VLCCIFRVRVLQVVATPCNAMHRTGNTATTTVTDQVRCSTRVRHKSVRAFAAEMGTPGHGAMGDDTHTTLSQDTCGRPPKARVLNCFQRAIVRHTAGAARAQLCSAHTASERPEHGGSQMITSTSTLLEELPMLTEAQLAFERCLAAAPERMQWMPEDVRNAVAGLLELAVDAPMAAASRGVHTRRCTDHHVGPKKYTCSLFSRVSICLCVHRQRLCAKWCPLSSYHPINHTRVLQNEHSSSRRPRKRCQ
jgi:hypothetical protein